MNLFGPAILTFTVCRYVFFFKFNAIVLTHYLKTMEEKSLKKKIVIIKLIVNFKL